MGFRWTSVMCRTLPSGFNINDKSIAMLISRQPGRESQRSRTLWPSPDYLSSLHLQPLDRIHHKNVSEIVKAQNVATSTQHPGPHTPRPCFCVFLLFLFVFLLLISLLSSSRPGGDQTWVRAQQTKHQSPLRWRVKSNQQENIARGGPSAAAWCSRGPTETCDDNSAGSTGSTKNYCKNHANNLNRLKIYFKLHTVPSLILDVSNNRGTPKNWMVCHGKPLWKWMIWGGSKNPIFGNTQFGTHPS